MDIFTSFATDENREIEGAWFEMPGDATARIKVARSSNQRYAKAVVKAYEKYAKVKKSEALEAQQEAEYNRLLAQHILVDWEGLSFKGANTPYSVAAAEKFLQIRDFRSFVQKCSEDFDAFRVEAEVEVGNA